MAVASPSATSGALSTGVPSYAGPGSVPLVSGPDGRRKTLRYGQVARANPWVFGAINARAGLASRMPLHVYRPDSAIDAEPGERERVRPGDGGPGSYLAFLLSFPEERLSGRRWRRRVLGDLLVHSNALVEYLFSASQIVGLRWQPWADVVPHLSSDGLRVESFEVPVERRRGLLGRMAGETRHIDATSAIHLTLADDTESPLGVSPLAPLHNTHALHDAALRFAVAYMDNGVFPSGMVEVPKDITPEQLTATRALIEQVYSGPDRAGKPFAAIGKWQQITASPEGARLVELAKLSREEVGGAYQTPMSVLGDTRDTNKATAQADLLRFVRYVVGGDIAVLETELQAQLIQPSRQWRAEGIVVEAEMAEMLRPDPVELAKLIQSEVGAPIATQNEGRRWVGLPRLRDPQADRLILNPGTPGTTDPDDEDDDEDDV